MDNRQSTYLMAW